MIAVVEKGLRRCAVADALVVDRKLVVNAAEADTARYIFRRYAVLKSVLDLKDDLDADGIVSKSRIDRFGTARGGKSLARGALYLMLQNRIYRGEIVHKDRAYPGLHAAIVDEALWDSVQAALADNRAERVTRSAAANPSLLAGLVYDAGGERMSPTRANKKGTRYRHYVSQSLIKRGRPQASEAACRIPAADLETLVEDRICALLKHEEDMFNAAGSTAIASRKSLIENAAGLARRWPAVPTSQKRAILHALVERVDVRLEAVEVSVRTTALPDVVKPELDIRRLQGKPEGAIQVLSVPARLRRTGMETKLLIQGALAAEPPRRADRSLLRLIAQARHFNELVMSSNGRSMKGLAAEAGVSPSYFTRVFRLSFLAPDITKAILQGRQPMELSAIKLMQAGPLAPDWDEQRRKLGFA